MRVVKALMWLSALVELSSSLLTISEICSRDMMKRWKSGRRGAQKGEGGPGEGGGGSRRDGRSRRKKRARRSHVSVSSGGKV